MGTFDPATGNYTGVLPNAKPLEDILLGIANAMGLPTGLSNAWDYWRKPITTSIRSWNVTRSSASPARAFAASSPSPGRSPIRLAG